MSLNRQCLISRRSLILIYLAPLLLVIAPPSLSEEVAGLEEMVITGVKMTRPLVLETDPKAPRQPLPAQDGADYLKTLPGFSVIRKGGTGGDPVFRGMAGSRLSLLSNGDLMLGGCSSRMDPPTAYIFPESYDRIRLIKGPQTVLYGPGNSAGVVLFERDQQRMDKAGWAFHGSALSGSFGRDDEVMDIRGGTPDFYIRGTGSHSQQDNYEDGDSESVHSYYNRWNSSLALGWTPSDNVTFELSGSRSNAEAAYADRGMDGMQFERENLNTKLVVENLSPLWRKLEAQLYYNDVDHVMDNYSLREPGDMAPMVSNTGRKTAGARLLATLAPTASAQLEIGMDVQRNKHTDRQTMNQMMMPYQKMPSTEDARLRQLGLFGEWTQNLAEKQRLIAGARIDEWRVRDQRETISMDMMMDSMDNMNTMMPMSMPNPTAGQERNETLSSGFIRYERDIRQTTFYAGVGRSERFPDYWELISKESLDSVSAFDAEPETTTQLDLGAIYRNGPVKGSISLFYNQIDDYLLIQSNVAKPMGMMSKRMTTVTRNIDATSWGMEADASYAFTDNWRSEASLATVRGTNKSDDSHLAQLPPIELRLGLYYNNPVWSAGVLWRAVDNQERIDLGKGNIVGQDTGTSDSFNVFSLNLGWRHKHWLITSGIDNLFNETYAEHISKTGTMIAGYNQTMRINEPGRTLWLKAQLNFE